METRQFESDIPYRCPKCIHSTSFITLSDLKMHLRQEHDYRRPQQRPGSGIFNYDVPNEKSDLQIEKLSPFYQSLVDDKNKLEDELRLAKEAEALHKKEQEKQQRKDVQESLNLLNQEVMRSRERKWDTDDALYHAHDVLENLQTSAEVKGAEQAVRAQKLKVELESKEMLLEKANQDVQSLKLQQEKLMKDMKGLAQKADMSDKQLEELNDMLTANSAALQTRERQLESLKTFIQKAAEKEGEAREKLEEFITNIINRADRAESELRRLRAPAVVATIAAKNTAQKRDPTKQINTGSKLGTDAKNSRRTSTPKLNPDVHFMLNQHLRPWQDQVPTSERRQDISINDQYRPHFLPGSMKTGTDHMFGDKEQLNDQIYHSQFTPKFENDIDISRREHSTVHQDRNHTPYNGSQQDSQLSVEPKNIVVPHHTEQWLHGRDTNQWLRGPDTNQQLHGPVTNQQLHGPVTNQQIHGPDTNQWLHGADTTQRLHSPDKNQRLHGPDTTQRIHSPDKNQRLHGADTTQRLHGTDTTQQLHSSDTNQRLHGPDTTQQLHGQDTTQQLHGPDTNQRLHGSETNQRLYGPDTIQQLHDSDTNQRLHGPDTDQRLHGLDINKHIMDYPVVSYPYHHISSPGYKLGISANAQIHSSEYGDIDRDPASRSRGHYRISSPGYNHSISANTQDYPSLHGDIARYPATRGQGQHLDDEYSSNGQWLHGIITSNSLYRNPDGKERVSPAVHNRPLQNQGQKPGSYSTTQLSNEFHQHQHARQVVPYYRQGDAGNAGRHKSPAVAIANQQTRSELAAFDEFSEFVDDDGILWDDSSESQDEADGCRVSPSGSESLGERYVSNTGRKVSDTQRNGNIIDKFRFSQKPEKSNHTTTRRNNGTDIKVEKQLLMASVIPNNSKKNVYGFMLPQEIKRGEHRDTSFSSVKGLKNDEHHSDSSESDKKISNSNYVDEHMVAEKKSLQRQRSLSGSPYKQSRFDSKFKESRVPERNRHNNPESDGNTSSGDTFVRQYSKGKLEKQKSIEEIKVERKESLRALIRQSSNSLNLSRDDSADSDPFKVDEKRSEIKLGQQESVYELGNPTKKNRSLQKASAVEGYAHTYIVTGNLNSPTISNNDAKLRLGPKEIDSDGSADKNSTPIPAKRQVKFNKDGVDRGNNRPYGEELTAEEHYGENASDNAPNKLQRQGTFTKDTKEEHDNIEVTYGHDNDIVVMTALISQNEARHESDPKFQDTESDVSENKYVELELSASEDMTGQEVSSSLEQYSEIVTENSFSLADADDVRRYQSMPLRKAQPLRTRISMIPEEYSDDDVKPLLSDLTDSTTTESSSRSSREVITASDITSPDGSGNDATANTISVAVIPTGNGSIREDEASITEGSTKPTYTSSDSANPATTSAEEPAAFTSQEVGMVQSSPMKTNNSKLMVHHGNVAEDHGYIPGLEEDSFDDTMSLGSVLSADIFALDPENRVMPISTRLQEIKRRRQILFCVFAYLDTRTLTQISLVCKEWMQVSRHPGLWRRVTLKSAKMSCKYLLTISKWCKKLKCLTLEGLRPRSRQENENTTDYLKNIRGSLEPGLEILLKKSQDSLLSLRIVDCGNIITDRCLWQVSCYSRLLQKLCYVSDTDPAGGEVLWALGAGCCDINTLILPPLHPCQKPEKFNNKCIQIITQCYRDLEVLSIGGAHIDQKGLMLIARCCQRLQELDLDHMPEVKEDMSQSLCEVGLRDLRVLDFTFTPVESKAVILFAKRCRRLRSVSIRLGITDYFQDTRKKKNITAYRKTMEKLEVLKKTPGISPILKLFIETV